ncbi:MAG: thioredoxin family protein, partial [Deltaproteobacteria bacterium]|nr:thioredoxin family protein [Deltaproteobacteria bacterium]
TSAPRFPAPYKYIEKGDILTFGYETETLIISDIYAPLVIPEHDAPITIRADVNWLVCKDSCVPGGRQVELTLPFGTESPLEGSRSYDMFQRFDAQTPQSLTRLRQVKGWEQFGFQPVVERTVVAPGQKFSAGVILTGIPQKALATIDNHVQLFPEANDVLDIGRPKISVLPSSSAEEPSRALAVFPLKGFSAAPSGLELRGTGVISCAICEQETDFTFEWRVPLRVEADDSAAEGWSSEFASAARNGKLLRFREASHGEDGAEVLAAEPGGLSAFGFLGALIAAFLAGIILNVMPCVLPVISLKVLGFVESGSSSRGRAFRNALVFASGVLFTFLVLALIVIGLKSVGYQVGWGFQFQEPAFVFGLAIILFLLSLGFFELYHIEPPGLQSANRAARHVQETPLLRHFFDGVLATLLSTPCTAPFLGTALAFALTQSAPFTVAIFLAIGAGLALPYVILSTSSHLIRHLPKPGPWMDTFKQILGFLLLGTVVWLLSVLESLIAGSVLPTLLLLLIMFFILWCGRKLAFRSGVERRSRALRAVVVCALLLSTVQTWRGLSWARASSSASMSDASVRWIPFSADRLEAEKLRKNVVFIDFTADWCITCKFNERFVLAKESVTKTMDELNVVALKADWTTRDPVITQALQSYGGIGVPHYVIIAPNGDVRTLPTVLTPGMVVDALKSAAAAKSS